MASGDQAPLLADDSAAKNGGTDIQDQLAQRKADMEARRQAQAAQNAPAAAASVAASAVAASSQPPAQQPPPPAAQNTFQSGAVDPAVDDNPESRSVAGRRVHMGGRDDERNEEDGYGYDWQIRMLDAPCSNPFWFCTSCLCGCCISYKQRKDIMLITGEPYKCCGGRICGVDTSPLPEIPCLCCETFCCTFTSIMVNRYMIRDMYQLKLDPCDEYLITMACIISWVICILKIAGVLGEDSTLEELADCFILSVMGCSLTQNQTELAFHEGRKLFDCDFENTRYNNTQAK